MTKKSCISDNYAKCNRFDRHCVGQQWTNFVYELGKTQIFCSLLVGSLSNNDATAMKTSIKKRILALLQTLSHSSISFKITLSSVGNRFEVHEF